MRPEETIEPKNQDEVENKVDGVEIGRAHV